MPEISRFFGIVIAMYYNDHAPPHFHAKYGEHQIGSILRPVNLSLDRFLGGPHNSSQSGLIYTDLSFMENWKLAEGRKPLRRIDPLE